MEQDNALRVAATAAVGLAVVAVAVTGAVPAVDAAVTLPLLLAGSWWSYRRRGRDNTPAKVLLALGAMLALWRFFGDVRIAVSFDDTRQPLAQLFLAVQVLHAFDLPARRDLGFSLTSSLTLVALAGTATADPAFGVLLAAYLAVAGVASAGLQRSAAQERADRLATRDRACRGTRLSTGGVRASAEGRAERYPVARVALPLLLAAALVFSLLPPPSRTRFGGLPFGGGVGPALADVGVTNPQLPFAGRAAGDGGGADGTGYFGFAEYVDLRSAGRPSADPVLRVRTDRPRLLRGMVFDTYDGRAWSRSSAQPQARTGPPVDLGGPPRPAADTLQIVATVELLRATPNLFFAAADPATVWSAGSVAQWDDGTLTTGALHDEGTVYSVVSRIDVSPVERLRAARGGPQLDPDDRARYLQLPERLPRRVRNLAARLTADADPPYAQAEAVQAWLGANTEYTLGAPTPPPGTDAVDHFLFTTRRGWCEPIAASMVVLLRAAGVPARFATGFQPGFRQPLTGWWTVRAADAHAWVEVWVPGHGWTSFDPTGAVPLALDPDPPAPRPPLLAALSWAADRFRLPAELVALAAAVAALVLALRRRRPRTARSPFDRLAALLAAEPWRTPREVAAAAPDLPAGALATLVAEEEARRYQPQTHSAELEAMAEQALVEVAAKLSRRR